MNISKEQIDERYITVSIHIGKDDYESRVGEVLRDYRRRVNLHGFRQGKVPEGLIRKMYGKNVLIEEINKLMTEALQNYVKEQDLKLLGEPLPKDKSPEIEWEIGNDFTFSFEMGLAPALDIRLSKEDCLNKYRIMVDQEMIDRNIDNYCKRFGQFVDVDAVVDFKERLSGDIVQLGDDGQPLQDGLSVEDSLMSLVVIKEEERKKPFENAKAGDEIVFNLSETISNPWEIVSILRKKDKNEVGDISESLFRFTVKIIQKYADAELNQELFDKVFGEGAVNSLEQFENRIRKKIETEFEESTMSRFRDDACEYLLKKINPPLPEVYLHKLLQTSRKENVDEATFEKEFDLFLKNMKWELIVKTIAAHNNLDIEEWEVVSYAKAVFLRQFAMYYGAVNFSDEELTGYAMNYLNDEKNVRTIASKILEDKVVKVVLETVDARIHEMTLADFNRMISDSNKTKTEKGEMEESAAVANDVSENKESAEAAEVANKPEVVATHETSEIGTTDEVVATKKKRTKKTKKTDTYDE